MDKPDEMHRWWDLFTTKGYRHVAAYGYSTDHDVWVVVDPQHKITLVQVLDHDGIGVWFNQRSDLVSSVLQMHVGLNHLVRSRFGFWCTIAIKQVLGLECGALTPRGLYRHMKQHGCKTVIDYGN